MALEEKPVAEDDNVVIESRSQRFVNYAKGVGTLLTGLTALVATGLSIWALVRRPPELVAREGYKAVDVVVKQLSTDLQKEHDARTHADDLLAKDVTAIRDQMQLVVQLLTARERRPPVSYLGGTSPRPGMVKAAPASQPAAILRVLSVQVSETPKLSTKKLMSPRPPLRKLPVLP
jgi:hypothetical protein